MKMIVKFPTRSRPQVFKDTFKRYQDFLSGRHDVRFLVSMDIDDESMNIQEMEDFLAGYSNTDYYYGESKSKIEAVNADLNKLPDEWDVLLLASDDMIPQIPGYDAIIDLYMRRHFPDFDGVLHFNDGLVGQRLNTLCILGKPYYERFGYIYHPDYTSVFADNEFTDVSRLLNRQVYIDQIIIKHRWKFHEGIGDDALMQRNEDQKWYQIDGAIYNQRKIRNFDLQAEAIK